MIVPIDQEVAYRQVLSDPARLETIQNLGLVDSPFEEVFDRLTRLAARLIPSPVALVSIVDAERQFFKSFVGLEAPWATRRQTPLSHSFCQHVVVSGQPLIIDDAREHELVRHNLAIPELGVVSYLGMPLATSSGHVLGSFCVIDSEVRQWSPEDIETVRELARSVMTEIELRHELQAVKQTEAENGRLLEKLTAANQDLTDFAYIVSHDLKAPLRGIGSIAEWLSADYAEKFDQEGQELMDLLLRRVTRLQNFIEGILRYSRVGRLEQEWELVDLQPLVEDVIENLDPPKEISVTIHNRLPRVYGGRVRLEQVFQNLLSNAIKYLDKPAGKIDIRTARQNGSWEIKVADTGPGIEPRHFEKIFQIFQTLAPRDEIESTGIGLTLVKKIVEMHGGRISVASKVGVGSAFTFTLPAIEEPAT